MKNTRLVWAFDIDGVITANPDYFKWWTYMLHKNHNKIHIITGRNPSRIEETYQELKRWGITYDVIAFMPPDLERDFKTQGEWKIKTTKQLNVDIWLDNDFKMYEKVYNLDFATCTAERISI